MRLLAVACAAALSGCASLVHGPMQTVNVVTDPAGAECSIGGMKVVSPAVVTLERSYSKPDAELSDSSVTTVYYPAGNSNVAVNVGAQHSADAAPDGYPVKCSLAGYQPVAGVLAVNTDWGFVAADVLFGGVIGGLLVDYAFGNSGYYLTPDVLALKLKPAQSQAAP